MYGYQYNGKGRGQIYSLFKYSLSRVLLFVLIMRQLYLKLFIGKWN